MMSKCLLFMAVILFSNLLDAAHIIFPRASLQHYCAVGNWERAEKLFTKKLKGNPKYKWGYSLTMLCIMRAFEDDREFLRTLIAYNEDQMIALPEYLVFDCAQKKHYRVFRIVLEKGGDCFSTSLKANVLLQLIKDQAPDDIFEAIFERYQKYYQTHQRWPVSLEERSRDGLETVLGYAFRHGHINHARMLLQNGADFVEGIIKKDAFGSYLMEKTDWDSAIADLWCEQEDPLRLLKHHVFKRDKVAGSLLIQFFLRAIDSPLFEVFEEIAMVYRYRELVFCLESVGHNEGQLELDTDEWWYGDDAHDGLGSRNREFFNAVTMQTARLARFLKSMPRFEPCRTQGCPGGAFSMLLFSRGTKHFSCEVCFHLQCVSCGKRHPQTQCTIER